MMIKLNRIHQDFQFLASCFDKKLLIIPMWPHLRALQHRPLVVGAPTLAL